MYISHKSNVLQAVHETEWQCRKRTKRLSKLEYGEWLNTVTTTDSEGHKTVDYSGETEYTIVECTDENVQERMNQLNDYINYTSNTGIVYNIKWSDSKVSATVGEETIQTHFTGDDTARDARVLAEKWANVRRDRDRRLAETDFHALSDSTLADNMKSYRQALRDVPEDNADPDDINWPVKP